MKKTREHDIGFAIKFDLKMKLSTMFLLLFLLQASASTYSQRIKISLDEQEASVKSIFDKIENATDFKFFFEDGLFDLDKKVTIKVKKKRVEEILDFLFADTSIDYGIIEKLIILTKSKILPIQTIQSPLKPDLAKPIVQSEIQGTVTDGNGVPLPGANVVEKGTTNGVTADFDGKFTLAVSDQNAILIVSYIGFAPKEVPLNGQTDLTINLMESTSGLDEVIVIGYGTQRKKDVTGAISSVSGDDLNVTRESNALNALAGKVAGLDVGINNAAPGSSPSLLIRGRSSLNFSNEPLIVLDGIPLEGGLNDINAADIASVQVLKDASSAAIYGARGANGVILITTKRGKTGKASFTYDTYYGLAQVSEQYDLLHVNGFVAMRQEAFRAAEEERQDVLPGTLPTPSIEDVLEPLQLASYQMGTNTDFNELGFRSGKQVNHQLGVSGGSEKVRYALSLNYFDQNGVFKLADYERYTFRANIDVNAGDRLKIGISQQASFSSRGNSNPILGILENSPLVIPFQEDGVTPTLDPLGDGRVWNILTDLVPENYINETKNFRYLANIFANYQIVDGLKYTLNVQPQFELITNNDFRASNTASRQGALATASKDTRTNTAYTIENILDYSRIFNELHSLNATFLYSFQDTQRERLILGVLGLPSETQTFNNLGDGEQVDFRDSELETEGWVSYMARFNYGYKNKYLLTLTGRYDGSSKLSKGNKWGFFPSASFAWRIIEENLLKEQTFFDDLKLRTGYGQVGRNPISPFATLGGITRFEGSFGGTPAFGFQPDEIANPDLEWERTTTFDIGIDFAFAANKISGSVDYYTGNTTDLLLNRVLPVTSGFSSILSNVGETKNSGLEVVLSTVNIDTKDFQWTTDFNFSTNRSEIVKLQDSDSDDIGNRWFIGEALSVYYDRVFDGIWQLDEADLADSFGRRPGDIKLVDLNNDESLNDDDRKIIGQQDPKWIGGLTSRMKYKGLDFTVALYTHQGHITQADVFQNLRLVGRRNDLDLNYWTPENPSNEYPRPNADRERPLDHSILTYRDGSFVRIRNITVGYDFDKKVAEYLKLQNLRVYATAQNPFLFTSEDLEGFDPEISNDLTAAPRTFLLGLNVSF